MLKQHVDLFADCHMHHIIAYFISKMLVRKHSRECLRKGAGAHRSVHNAALCVCNQFLMDILSVALLIWSAWIYTNFQAQYFPAGQRCLDHCSKNRGGGGCVSQNLVSCRISGGNISQMHDVVCWGVVRIIGYSRLQLWIMNFLNIKKSTLFQISHIGI